MRIHGRGRIGVMHHPTCRVRVVLREVLSEERAAGFKARLAFGRAKSDDEKLAEALKRHLLFRPMKVVGGGGSEKMMKRYDVAHMPWNKKGWKYVTSPKWTGKDAWTNGCCVVWCGGLGLAGLGWVRNGNIEITCTLLDPDCVLMKEVRESRRKNE